MYGCSYSLTTINLCILELNSTDTLEIRKWINAVPHRTTISWAAVPYLCDYITLQDILNEKKFDESSELNFLQFLELLPKNSKIISGDEHRWVHSFIALSPTKLCERSSFIWRLAELREKFQRYDHHHQGFIRLSEASWALQMELEVTPATALRLLNQFVRMDYNQFCDFYEKIQQK